jgi:hypothetical protein
MWGRILLTGVAVVVLAGCGSNVKPGFVAKQWAAEMRELQINPVFPPREDFQVGDIYLPAVPQEGVAQKVEEEGYLPISVWLMEAGGPGAAAKELETFYATRSTYPQTSKALVDAVEQAGGDSSDGDGNSGTDGAGSGDGADLTGPVPQPVLDCSDVRGASGADCNIFTSRETSSLRRMRIVGFPTFLSTTITEGNLSAFVPIEAFTAAIGLDFGDVEKVSVSVPVAESVGLPAMTALNLTRKSLARTQDRLCPGRPSGGSGTVGALAAVLPHGQRTEDGQVGPSFHAVVITEVFYTRAIEISVETQESFGLGGQLTSQTPTGGGTAAQAGQAAAGAATGQGNATGTQSDQQGNGTADGADGSSRTPPSPGDRLKQLRHATSDLPSTPGGSLQVVSVADGNVGMRRIYDRPIAIGYRGLSLTIDSQTCQITGGGAADDVGVMTHGSLSGTNRSDTRSRQDGDTDQAQ